MPTKIPKIFREPKVVASRANRYLKGMGDAYVLKSAPDESPFNEAYFFSTAQHPAWLHWLVLRNSRTTLAWAFEVDQKFTAFPFPLGLTSEIAEVASVEASQQIRGFVRRCHALESSAFGRRVRSSYFESKLGKTFNPLELIELGLLLPRDLRLTFLNECLRRTSPDLSTRAFANARRLLRADWARAGFVLLVPRRKSAADASMLLGLRILDAPSGIRWRRPIFSIQFSPFHALLRPLPGSEALAMVVGATYPGLEHDFLSRSYNVNAGPPQYSNK